MEQATIIDNTIHFVKQTLKNAEGGHDWWHINRVWTNARLIAQTENADLLVIELAALLHDIADSKFHNGDEEVGPATAGNYLQTTEVDPQTILHVQNIIRYMSYKSNFDKPAFHSPELAIVQDADRLDAIGAIGIARAFNYGGFKGREIYNPEIKPDLNMSKEAYKNSTAPTINHFYEKLLLLKDKMNTETGKRLAQQRHDFMEQYLQQFYIECK
ncbi:HD domain-containing protein [Mucilaginibacter sp. UR6-11]|uniref:HD domain-containing protein n=1 Tax=Mucilaginibacter sp. UR6-11 TaxID=1435644 RepID=UPI001E332D53|nr:HD domain-containing protein [Mucilaginibacter sp. UR6-11]MCC8424990.1 HD domain-containing protein [Mucilaginibacter sp. UR6-11]